MRAPIRAAECKILGDLNKTTVFIHLVDSFGEDVSYVLDSIYLTNNGCDYLSDQVTQFCKKVSCRARVHLAQVGAQK